MSKINISFTSELDFTEPFYYYQYFDYLEKKIFSVIERRILPQLLNLHHLMIWQSHISEVCEINSA